MKNLKQELSKVWTTTILTSLFLMIIGIMMIIYPDEIISIISIVIGIGIIIAGILAFLKYFRESKEQDFFRFDLIYGVISVLAGTLLIVNPKAVASILPLVLGIWMVINSVIKVQYALTLKQYGNTSWLKAMILALITLAGGILLVFNPFEGAAILTQIIGAILVTYAIIDIIDAYMIRKNLKAFTETVQEAFDRRGERIETAFDDDVTDATYEEVKKGKRRKDKKKRGAE